ncbi:MAG: dihydropyrimidinase [Gemmatimonadetes bacterium]|nr:dihydropyrimidinase [Gemmatimonadota bacterium]
MTHSFDLVVRNGTAVTASASSRYDIGVSGGKVMALGEGLGSGRVEIDATAKLVLPGGVDSHCHIEQKTAAGIMCADDFLSGTVSAACGGTTTVMSFAAQHRGMSVTEVVADYHERARPKAVIDYAFHLIIADPTPEVMRSELPDLIRQGHRSLKVFMTYDRLRLDDYQILEVLALARREGALTMVHAENHDIIRWLKERLLERDHVAPKFHAVSHHALAERDAISRMITLAELLDAPILIVHVSTEGGVDTIRSARARGLRVYGETCPQYLFLTADDLDREGMLGAKYCCSPPPRAVAAQKAMWCALADGTFQVFSSDHAPFRFDATGKLVRGPSPPFPEIANGVPGLEVRMPLLFSEGVLGGRIDIHRFVDLTATRAAKIYGLFPQKGTIAVGSDADLAIWDPERLVTLSTEALHDNVGYTPYEGRRVKGWPVTVISRGRVVVHEGRLEAEPGSGRFITRCPPEWAETEGRSHDAAALARRFGAEKIFSNL